MAFTPQAARIPSILPGLGWSRGICPTYARCFRAIFDFVEDRLHRIFCRAQGVQMVSSTVLTRENTSIFMFNHLYF